MQVSYHLPLLRTIGPYATVLGVNLPAARWRSSGNLRFPCDHLPESILRPIVAVVVLLRAKANRLSSATAEHCCVQCFRPPVRVLASSAAPAHPAAFSTLAALMRTFRSALQRNALPAVRVMPHGVGSTLHAVGLHGVGLRVVCRMLSVAPCCTLSVARG